MESLRVQLDASLIPNYDGMVVTSVLRTSICSVYKFLVLSRKGT